MAGGEFFGFFKGFSMTGIVDKIYSFLGLFLLLLVLGGLLATFFLVRRKKQGGPAGAKVGWWEEIGNRLEPTNMEPVEEIVIPGTILRIFYGPKRNIWLPRFSRGVAKDLYYVALTPTRQMVNFTIPSISNDLKNANLEFDHTDMLWAAENSREYIKRNYKDKSMKWWQLYQKEISLAIMILVMTFSFILIIYFMRGIVQDLSSVVGQIGEWSKDACMRSQSSGIMPAGG